MRLEIKKAPRAGQGPRGESIREDAGNTITVDADTQYMKSLEKVREARRRFDMGTGTEEELRSAMEDSIVAGCADIPPQCVRAALNEMPPPIPNRRKPRCV